MIGTNSIFKAAQEYKNNVMTSEEEIYMPIKR